jgi:hypothetical protein
MGKIRYFMCPFVLTSKDKGRQDGRAILTVEGCLNIAKIEKRIKEADGIEDGRVICTGFFEMSEEDYMSNFME